MKKLFITLLTGLMLTAFVNCTFASDIEVSEARPTITTWRLDTVRIFAFTSTCVVTYRKGYISEGNFISNGDEIKVVFMNIADNPDTPEDETNNEFTQLINAINNGDNIKQTITNAVKIKLGLN